MVVAALALAACAGRTSEALTVVASSPGALAAGPEQRILMVIASPDGQLLGGPDLPATVVFASGDSTLGPMDAEWVWGIEGVRGFYVARASFPSAGIWEATLTTDDGETEVGAFQVSEEAVVPEVGDPAPPSDSRTSADAPLVEISTDPDPDPSFYELSVGDAVADGRPTVIVFATPAFCQTAVCGPVLDLVEQVAPDHPGADFVHVEIYEDIDNPDGPQQQAQAVLEWGLQTEPWVFVVDAEGIVAARFEGALGAAELQRALAAVGA